MDVFSKKNKLGEYK
jgi:hypothetical protein